MSPSWRSAATGTARRRDRGSAAIGRGDARSTRPWLIGPPSRRLFELVSESGGDAGAEFGSDAGPVGDDASLDGLADAGAGMGDDVGGQILTVGVVHDLGIERARLDEVVVVRVGLVGIPAELG